MLDIKWNIPYSITHDFTTKWKREWCIQPHLLTPFFAFWKENRIKMMVNGYSVTKDKESGKWYLHEVKNDISLFENVDGSKNDVSIKPEIKFELPDYEIKDKSGLREWQIVAAGKLVSAINHWGAACDGSEMGLGKTFETLAVTRELNVPFVVVCPKAVINQWTDVINNHFKLSEQCKGVINYELLIRGRKDSSIASFVLKRDTRRKQFTWKLPKNCVIIWDEAHKLKNFKTKSSKCCIEAHKQGYRMLFLSATLAISPMDLRTVGICSKMFKNGQSYYDWAYAHGVFKDTWGLCFNNDPKVLKKLNTYVFEHRGIRHRRDQVLNFPECEVIVQSYNIDESKVIEINRAYKEMSTEIKRLDTLLKNEDSALVIRLRYRQKIELLKVDLFVELAQEALDNGMSVLLFMNYTETIKALSNRFNTTSIYSGQVSDKEKQKNINNFQSNKEKIMIVQIKSGGTGLSIGDLDGNHPRLSIISPDDSARDIRQCCGRANRENSKSKSIVKIPCASGTIEDSVTRNFQSKNNNIDIVNDGDFKII